MAHYERQRDAEAEEFVKQDSLSSALSHLQQKFRMEHQRFPEVIVVSPGVRYLLFKDAAEGHEGWARPRQDKEEPEKYLGMVFAVTNYEGYCLALS